jgi:hypothetical protein
MLRRIIFLLCLPGFFLSAVPMEEASSKFSTGPAPAWVKPCDFGLESPVKPSQIHIQRLLEDTQINWEEKTAYVHKVIKVLNQTGAEGFTQWSIDFDPTYQSLVVHAIRVVRNGESIDCLEKSHYKLLQREQSLDQNLYEGDLSLVYFLNDIRAGDIVDLSCSIIGTNPLFTSHFTHLVALQDIFTIEKIYKRILIHPDTPLQMKSFHTSIQPKIVDLSPTLREWSWEVVETPASSLENDEPSWYNPLARVQITQYQSWQEVAQKVLPLFLLPDDFESHPSTEMLALIKKWTESTADVFQRATLALRFVQDEVKYMGFEDGIGGCKPTDPRVVLARRFGDCKDKSLLLHAFLKLMNIGSTPALVDAEMGKRLPEVLPSLSFDHAVLRIEINGSHYWVDPTMTYQGGSLASNFFPNYEWALMISSATTELTPLPSETAEKPIEILTSIIFTSPDSADLKIERTGYGNRAERMRRSLQRVSLKDLSRTFLEDAQKTYKGASLLSPLSVQDDRDKNMLTIQEHYKISTRTRMGKKILKASSSLLENYLDNNINLERSAPYALSYPLWVKEHIHIENPYNDWEPDAEEAHYENEVVQFTYGLKKEGHTADFDFELKHLKDHVPVPFVQDYWNMIHEIEPNPSLEVVIANSVKP